MLAVIIFILILLFLVMIHELGHFIAAKRSGIGVEEFGFGLPPRIWGKKVGETIYSVNWLPFGGFVRLVGEDSTDKHKNAKNSFYTKSIAQRARVVVAGVFMNFAVAILVFYVVVFALGFKVNLPLIVDHKFAFVNQFNEVLVADVGADSPAKKAGIEAGSAIVVADGKEISSIPQLQGVIRSHDNTPVELVLENPVDNSRRTVVVTPVYNNEVKAPALGVELGEIVALKYETFGQKLFAGFIHSYNTFDYSMKVFGKLIAYSFKERDFAPVSENVSGPVGIVQITSQAVSLGPISVLQLIGLLSLNLAVLNILPIPALDGGRFAFIIFELVTRKKVNATFEKWVHTVGFVVLIGLIVLITYNDVLKLFQH